MSNTVAWCVMAVFSVLVVAGFAWWSLRTQARQLAEAAERHREMLRDANERHKKMLDSLK